jgi:hypothetical protein
MLAAAGSAHAEGGAPVSTTAPVLWGVDSVLPITPTLLADIDSAFGPPDFFGRYLTGRDAVTRQEAGVAFGHGVGILLLDNGLGTAIQTGSDRGTAAAVAASTAAAALGVPAGVAIFRDVETASAVDTAFVRGYVDAMAQTPYIAGFYGNPVNGEFASAYCGAVAASPAYSGVAFFSSEPEPGRGPRSQAPAFAPAALPCPSTTVAWQYGEPGSKAFPQPCVSLAAACPHVDADEALAAIPLWTAKGASTAAALLNGGFEIGAAGWTVAANTSMAVRTGDAAKRGASYAVARARSRPGAIYQTSLVPTGSGTTYTLSAWVRADPSVGRGFVKGSIVLFAMGGRTQGASEPFRVGGTWTRVSVQLVPTGDARTLLAALYLDTAKRGLDIDGVRLAPTTHVSGSVGRSKHGLDVATSKPTPRS